jgi:ribosomal 30S subunit maturation factor RimM
MGLALAQRCLTQAWVWLSAQQPICLRALGRAHGVHARRHTRRQVHILKFEGYNSPEEAFEALVGRTLLVDAKDRPALDDDDDMTYFVSDLIGMHCVNLVRPSSGATRPLGCWGGSLGAEDGQCSEV